ncbi:MAG: COX15/CtaA family protein [Solirubrobacterales bacterium]
MTEYASLAPDAALRRFRRTVTAALVGTYLLVVVGGIVRIGDSGLGCGPAGSGLRGWPLCQGRLVPHGQLHPVVEYTHRFLAAVVVILLAAILWQALRRLRDQRLLVGGAVAAMILVAVQAVLGGLTVEHGLETALVAAHLVAAMLLLGILVGLLAATRPAGASVMAAGPLRALAVTACVLLLATIASGGVVAGTEYHGTPGSAGTEGAHLACGREFPTCNGAVLPYGDGEMVAIQLAHRTAMILALAAIALLAFFLARRRDMGEMPFAIALVLATQVLLGAANVWLGEHAILVVAHLALGTLLWVLVASVTAVLSSRARPVALRPTPQAV